MACACHRFPLKNKSCASQALFSRALLLDFPRSVRSGTGGIARQYSDHTARMVGLMDNDASRDDCLFVAKLWNEFDTYTNNEVRIIMWQSHEH